LYFQPPTIQHKTKNHWFTIQVNKLIKFKMVECILGSSTVKSKEDLIREIRVIDIRMVTTMPQMGK